MIEQLFKYTNVREDITMKKTYKIEVDCANCARKMENTTNATEGVKAAVVTLTYAQRSEIAPLGIDMCTICPGDIKTNFTNNRIKEFETNERYGNAIEKATKKVDSRENKRIPAKICAIRMFKIINKKKFKPMYIIGGQHKFLYFIKRLVPVKWLLWGINKVCG